MSAHKILGHSFTDVFNIMLDSHSDADRITKLLLAINELPITADLLVTAAHALRSRMTKITAPPNTIDIVGTGGDGLNTLNVSTATALVVAACGVAVAKHGNRAASSQSGAADVLVALGVNINAAPQVLAHALQETNFAFLLAPTFHPALTHLAPIRKALGVRTIFNLLGPLVNPAGITNMLLGVADKKLLPVYAEALPQLDITNAWIVSGHDGMDELSPCGENDVISLKNGIISQFIITPEDAGLPRCTPQDITGGDAAYNATALTNLLDSKPSAYRNAVLYNAGAALVIAERANSLLDGVNFAATIIDSGQAKQKLQQYTQNIKS